MNEVHASPGAADGTGPIERSQGDHRIFAGRYRLLSRRGRATDVALFEAVDTLHDRTVAVKIVHPDLCARPGFAERFHETMQQVASMRHPNLTEVLDVDTSTWGGRTVHYVVCENLTGGSLRDLHDRGRLLSPSQVVLVGLDACRGLDAAHRAGMVHGSLRPNALVFGDDGRLRVADLGLTALVADEWWDDPSGVDAETARYASPEQAQGRAPTSKSDVYSLALCLLESVTGSVPFVADSAVSTLAQRVDRLLPVSADLGPLAAVFGRAGLPDVDDRSTAAEFGRALHGTAEKLPRPAPLQLLSGAAADAPAAPMASAAATVPMAPAAPAAPMTSAPPPAPAPAPVPPAATPVASAGPVAPIPPPAGPAEAPPTAPSPAAGAPSTDRSAAPAAPAAVAPPVAPAPSEPLASSSPSSPSTPSTVAEGTERSATSVGHHADADADAEALPSHRRRWPIVLLALLVVAGLVAGAAWWFTRTISHEVPALAGTPQAEALNTISEMRWDVVVTEEADDDVPAGVVIRTDPVAGTSLAEGEQFTLVVSTGPAPRTLPDVAGLTVADATEQLAALDLVLEVSDRPFDDEVPVDAIVSWQVPDQPALVAGDTVLPGTTILVAVSAGPAPRVVPDLTGLPLDQVTAALDELALVLVPLPDEFHPTVPVGGVARQDPAPGTEVAKGASVSVAISKGPDLVAVPPLADLTVDQARAALEAAGLVLGAVNGDPAGVNVLAEVGGVSVGGGAQFPRGTAIDLTFEVPAPPDTEATTDTTTA